MAGCDRRELGYVAVTLDESRSPLEKYQELVVGNRNLWSLLKYEMLTLGVSAMPGLPGLLLRRWLYPRLFKRMGRGVIIGQGISVRQPGKISIGDNTLIDDYCSLSVRGSEQAGIEIGNNVFIGRNSQIKTREGKIEIEDFANVGTFCRIASIGRTRIGKNAGIAAYCYIGMSNHKTDSTSTPIIFQEMDNRGGVDIGDGTWVGAGSKIHDGVKIGAGSIVAAGSVVHQDIPELCIAAGVPARILARRRPDALGETQHRKPTMGTKDAGAAVNEDWWPDAGRQEMTVASARDGVEIRERAAYVLRRAIDEINQQLPKEKQLEKFDDAPIFDKRRGAGLDSLVLLNFIVTVEQKIEEEFGRSINLTDERALSQNHSPFTNIGTLARYMAEILSEEKSHG